MQDPELPPLPQPVSARPRPSVLTRKRTRDDYQEDVPMSAASSDPALFSGDEYTPGAEDYSTKKKKKKMYTGSWWSYRMKANSQDKKREFKRNYDSGIFMGSEDSEPPSSDSLGSLEEEFMRDQGLQVANDTPTTKPTAAHSRSFARPSSLPMKPTVFKLPPGHETAIEIVRKSLETGREQLDLSGLCLAGLPAEVSTLSTLTRNVNLVPGMLGHGERLTAHLRLYLANNALRRFPRELFDLSNLRELSLRRNKLLDIPPGIRSLVKLHTFNIAGNRIPHLPFEIIELVRRERLTDIITVNNAWIAPPASADTDGGIKWFRPDMNIALTRWRKSPDHSQGSEQPGPAAPSLTEVTLRSLSRIAPGADLRPYMPPDTSSSAMAALEDLYESHLDGGYRCSRCHRTIIRPGYEEIEWWHISSEGPPPLETAGEAVRQYWLGDLRLPSAKELAQAIPVKRIFCHRDCGGKMIEWCDEPESCEKITDQVYVIDISTVSKLSSIEWT